KTSSDERTGGKSKQEFGGRNKSKIGQIQQEEISHVLWAHRTMIKSSNGDTPFSLTYGTEAVIPAEIGMPTFRTAEVNVAENDEALEINLELLEEKQEQTAIREAKKQEANEKILQHQSKKCKLQAGRPGVPEQRSKPCKRHWKVRTQVGRPIRSHRSTWVGIVQVKRPQRKRTPANLEYLQSQEMLYKQSVSSLTIWTP
ncbi:reverse transcriptase domain-containing protein, partial [Tanacetum coccineum]